MLLIARFISPEYRIEVWRDANELRQTLFYLGGALLLWLIVDRRRRSFYGMKAVRVRPFLAFLVLAAPVIVAASFLPEFRRSYPAVSPPEPISFWGSNTRALIAFEALYLFAYIAIEFFFRGLMVDGMRRWIGPSAILPMAAVYVALHFGKPVPETVSSLFGGMLLGIITYRTGSVAGGIIAHVGIAAMMELAGAAQRYGISPL